tara:strand:- start:1582 stop:2583 length:1002 start_codon:yes stop_codon:yes gene_type:complete
MALDYNQDIAPLRQQYFPMQMGERAFDQSMKYRQEVLLPMQQKTMQMQSNILKMQSSELAFQRQSFELGQARKAARRENEAMERIPEVIDLINTITDDPTKDVFERQKGIAKLQMHYQPYARYSPLVNNLFTSASRSIEQDYKKETQNDQLIQNAALRGVPSEKIADLASKDGVLSMSDEASIGISSALEGKTQRELGLKQFELMEEHRKEDVKALTRRAEDIKSTLISLVSKGTSSTSKTDLVGGFLAEKQGAEQGGELAKQEFLKKRDVLEELYYDLLSPAEKVAFDRAPDAMPDEQMFSAVYRRASALQRSVQMPERGSGSSTISSSFTK